MVMSNDGKRFPQRSKFEEGIHTQSNADLVEALKTHLQAHGHGEYGRRIISQTDYDVKFPSKLRHTLGRLLRDPCTTWESGDVAFAALAADAFDGDHVTLHQVRHYDWMTEEIASCCHAHMKKVCDETSQFEVEVSYMFKEVRDYKKSLHPIAGVSGRVDCVVGRNTIVEFKFAKGTYLIASFATVSIHVHVVVQESMRGGE